MWLVLAIRGGPSVASRGLLRNRGLHEGGPVGGGQFGQLECQLGVLDDGVRQHLLVPVPDVVVLLDHLRIPGDFGATTEGVAGAYVLQVKQLVVIVALVTKPKVDTLAVLGGRSDKVRHDLWNLDGQLAIEAWRECR